jgi:2-polyprenyl-3-methyl-5-hydroxy-6-metoxy-1,4-benzoquinol methylase
MPNFSIRSHQKELMDFPVEDKQALFLNLKELIQINKLTGGPQLVFKKIKQLFRKQKSNLTLLDIGFGAGDLLHTLHQKQATFPFLLHLKGVDCMPEAHFFVKKTYPQLLSEATFIMGDYKEALWGKEKSDIITANLLCHHLTDADLLDFLITTHKAAKKVVIINDLHRHPLAYWGIKLYCFLFTRSYFTQNDAPLSVLRGFTKKEWRSHLKQAGIQHYTIEWKWAFRYLITIYP